VIVLPQQSFVFGSFSLATTSSQWMLFLLVGFLYQALFTVPQLIGKVQLFFGYFGITVEIIACCLYYYYYLFIFCLFCLGSVRVFTSVSQLFFLYLRNKTTFLLPHKKLSHNKFP